jgi:hypothetical protein
LFESNRKKQRNAEIRLEAFGSYATPQLCTFAGDVDLALWGVVPVATYTVFEDDDRKKAAKQSQQRQDKEELSNDVNESRVQKWKEALAELDAMERSDDDIVQQQESSATDAGASASDAAQESIEEKSNEAMAQSTADHVHVPQQNAQDFLSVIDRVGDDSSEVNGAWRGGKGRRCP